MLKKVIDNRELVFELAQSDFKKKYITSALGVVWGFIPCLVTLLVYWFVFNFAFHANSVSNVPYLLWLMGGLVPWFYFSDCMGSGVNCYVEYSYLVKKMVFNLEIIPFVKVISNLYSHIFFLGITVVSFAITGNLTIYMLQIFYYLFAMICLITSLISLLSVLNVFFRDVSHIVFAILQAWVWMTPVIWSETQFAPNIVKWLKFNPMFYIVTGYRSSLIGGEWFWQNLAYMAYFWLFVIFCYILGQITFKKLKGHFSDLL